MKEKLMLEAGNQMESAEMLRHCLCLLYQSSRITQIRALLSAEGKTINYSELGKIQDGPAQIRTSCISAVVFESMPLPLSTQMVILSFYVLSSGYGHFHTADELSLHKVHSICGDKKAGIDMIFSKSEWI